jgi:hypothetical protein
VYSSSGALRIGWRVRQSKDDQVSLCVRDAGIQLTSGNTEGSPQRCGLDLLAFFLRSNEATMLAAAAVRMNAKRTRTFSSGWLGDPGSSLQGGAVAWALRRVRDAVLSGGRSWA